MKKRFGQLLRMGVLPVALLMLVLASGLYAQPEGADVTALLDQLESEDEYEQLDAIYELAMLDDARAVEPLAGLLNREWDDWRVYEVICGYLSRMKDPRSVPVLIEALDNEDTRLFAIMALGEIGDARAIDGLIATLDDEDWEERGAAVTALGQIGGARVVPYIVVALDDEDSSVQQNAELALAEIRTPEVADALVKVIANHDGRDVPYTVIDALGEIGGSHAAEAILKVIPAYDGLQNWCVLLALRSIEQPASGVRDDAALKRVASTFQQSPADAMDALFQLLDQGNWKTKTEAMKGLVFVRDASVTTRLLERIESDDPDVRLLATGLLALYDEPAPVVAEAILKACKSPDPAVRRFAFLSDACQSQADFPQWCVEALDDDDYVVRIIALRKLSELNNPKFSEAVNAGKKAEPAWIKAYIKGLK